MCLAAPKNFTGFAAVRCLLGFAEGAVSPAFITITSIWYKKKEHPLGVGVWVTCNGLAQIVGSLMMYGIGEHQGYLAIAPWRIMLLLCGVVAIFAGILFFFAMPAGPDTFWLLKPEEKVVAAKRLASQHNGGDKISFPWKQSTAACADPKTLHVFMFGLLVTMCSPVLTFASPVIKNLGYTSGQTLLYGSLSGAIHRIHLDRRGWLHVVSESTQCGSSAMHCPIDRLHPPYSASTICWLGYNSSQLACFCNQLPVQHSDVALSQQCSWPHKKSFRQCCILHWLQCRLYRCTVALDCAA